MAEYQTGVCMFIGALLSWLAQHCLQMLCMFCVSTTATAYIYTFLRGSIIYGWPGVHMSTVSDERYIQHTCVGRIS